jgi:hypothetical protein
MNQLTVFPSNAVARWIDADWLARERDPVREQPPNTRGRDSDIQIVRRQVLAREPRLRYRPFERLPSLYLLRMA